MTLGSLVLLCALAAALTFYFNPLWVSDLSIRLHLRDQHVLTEYIDLPATPSAPAYKIHYFEAFPPRIQGKLLAPDYPLLLIHGLGSRAEDWSPLIPTLASRGFHVYALDLLGYGRSSRPPDADYSIALQEQTVLRFLQAVHLDHADIAGWSMGGWIALRLAADHPTLVDRLVVYDAAGVYFPPTFEASLFTPTDSAGLSTLTHILSPHPQPLPPFVQRAAIRKLRANAWIINRSVASMTSGRDLLDFHLHKIKSPTLIVWGAQDTLIPPSVAETLHRTIRNSSLILVEGCGHLAPAECAHPVLRSTIRFLRASPPLPPITQQVPNH